MRHTGHKERGLNWSHLPALFAGCTPWGQLFSVLMAGHLGIRLHMLRILWKEWTHSRGVGWDCLIRPRS